MAYEQLRPLHEEDPDCPFRAVLERELSTWEQSQEEVVARLKLGEVWSAARLKQPFPVWQARLLVKELAFMFMHYRMPYHISEFRLTLVAMRLGERLRIANTEDGSLLLVFQETNEVGGRNLVSTTTAPEVVASTSSSLNLRKLVDVERVADDIVQGKCAISALRELQKIKDRQDQVGRRREERDTLASRWTQQLIRPAPLRPTRHTRSSSTSWPARSWPLRTARCSPAAACTSSWRRP